LRETLKACSLAKYILGHGHCRRRSRPPYSPGAVVHGTALAGRLRRRKSSTAARTVRWRWRYHECRRDPDVAPISWRDPWTGRNFLRSRMLTRRAATFGVLRSGRSRRRRPQTAGAGGQQWAVSAGHHSANTKRDNSINAYLFRGDIWLTECSVSGWGDTGSSTDPA